MTTKGMVLDHCYCHQIGPDYFRWLLTFNGSKPIQFQPTLIWISAVELFSKLNTLSAEPDPSALLFGDQDWWPMEEKLRVTL